MLLYRSENLAVTGEMLKVLEGFHHRAARRITGMTAKHVADTEWKSPPVVVALEAATGLPLETSGENSGTGGMPTHL